MKNNEETEKNIFLQLYAAGWDFHEVKNAMEQGPEDDRPWLDDADATLSRWLRENLVTSNPSVKK